jgi:hypothetical protein
MISRMKTLFIVLLSVGLTSGCTRSNRPTPEAKKPPSSVETMIDGATGRTAVNAGQKAKAEITRISEEHNRDLDAIME